MTVTYFAVLDSNRVAVSSGMSNNSYDQTVTGPRPPHPAGPQNEPVEVSREAFDAIQHSQHSGTAVTVALDGTFTISNRGPLPYDVLRRREYPSASDQLGAFMKGGQELLDMQAKIQAVKDKYPKP